MAGEEQATALDRSGGESAEPTAVFVVCENLAGEAVLAEADPLFDQAIGLALRQVEEVMEVPGHIISPIWKDEVCHSPSQGATGPPQP